MKKLIIAGLGPGPSELVTLAAFNEARDSDLILIPKSHENDNRQGAAEKIIFSLMPEKNLTRLFFPMISDAARRDEIIYSQLLNLKDRLENSKKIFFPVIGDSMLYSTGAYLLDSMLKIFPELEYKFLPGVSAHSLVASIAKKFLAQGDEILTIIPGTLVKNPEKILNALKFSDTVAIYKPTAIENIKKFLPGPFRKIIRVDFAGIPEKEKIFYGAEALENINEYLSLILIWR